MEISLQDLNHLRVLIIIMVISGIFGGVVHFLGLYTSIPADDKAKISPKWIFWRSVCSGVAATFIVPLFLQMIASSIIVNSAKNLHELLVFVSFCLVAAIIAPKFIESMGERLLQQISELGKQSTELTRKSKELDEEAKETQAALNVLVDASTDQPVAEPVQERTPETVEVPEQEEGDVAKPNSVNTIGKQKNDHHPDSELKWPKELLLAHLSVQFGELGANILYELFSNRTYAFRSVTSLARKFDVPAHHIDSEVLSLQHDGYVVTRRRHDGTRVVGLAQSGYLLFTNTAPAIVGTNRQA
ncbi:YEATS-associated helix-containing protein [Dyadobacter sp. OTU695]|uniref:YEATS-associated helix-containing protein n=1 Tax=Dyadobacter sp. OTU695 TaxID=3043860 RepID=UPI00313B0845